MNSCIGRSLPLLLVFLLAAFDNATDEVDFKMPRSVLAGTVEGDINFLRERAIEVLLVDNDAADESIDSG